MASLKLSKQHHYLSCKGHLRHLLLPSKCNYDWLIILEFDVKINYEERGKLRL